MNNLELIKNLSINLDKLLSQNTLPITHITKSLAIYRDAYDDGAPNLQHLCDDCLFLELEDFKKYDFVLLDAIARLSSEHYNLLIRAVLNDIQDLRQKAPCIWEVSHRQYNKLTLILAATPINELYRVFHELLLPIDLVHCLSDKIFWRFFILRNGMEQISTLHAVYLQYLQSCQKKDQDLLIQIIPQYGAHIISERIFALNYQNSTNYLDLCCDQILSTMFPQERSQLPDIVCSSINEVTQQASEFRFEKTAEKLFNLIDLNTISSKQFIELIKAVSRFHNTDFIMQVCNAFVEKFGHNCTDDHFMKITSSLFKGLLSRRRACSKLKNYIENTIITLFKNHGQERIFQGFLTLTSKPVNCFISLIKNSIHFEMSQLFVLIFDFVHKKYKFLDYTPYPWSTVVQHNKDLIIKLMSCRSFQDYWEHILQQDSSSMITNLLGNKLTPINYNFIAENNSVYAKRLASVIFSQATLHNIIKPISKFNLIDIDVLQEIPVIYSITSLTTLKKSYVQQQIPAGMLKDELLKKAAWYQRQLNFPDRKNLINDRGVEVFCMNLTLVADYFLSPEEKAFISANSNPNQEQVQPFISFYKKGLFLWANNHLMQRKYPAIEYVQSYIEKNCPPEHPYHGIWTVKNHPSFEHIHQKYEKFARQLEQKIKERDLTDITKKTYNLSKLK